MSRSETTRVASAARGILNPNAVPPAAAQLAKAQVLAAARARARIVKDGAQAKQIHQAWVVKSIDFPNEVPNNPLPTPGLINRCGNVPGRGAEDFTKNDHASLYSASIAQNMISPPMCESPCGPRRRVAIAVDHAGHIRLPSLFSENHNMLTIPRKALRLSALAASMTAALWMAGCSTTSTQADANKGPAPITDAKPANNLNGNGANNNGVPSTAVKPVEVGNTSAADADASLARVVYFDFDSNVVKDEFRGVIEANAKRLSANSAKNITIEGHTDECGGRE